MWNIRNYIILVFLALLAFACKVPNSLLIDVTPTPTHSLTPTLTSTSTTTPTPTLTPTPIPAARVASGDQALFNGDWETARKEYESVLQNDANPEIRSAALLGLGRVYYLEGDYARARDILGEVVGTYPDSPHLPESYFFLAQTHTALARYAEAAEAYAQYLNHRPGVIDAYIQEMRGDVLVAGGEHQSAIEAYQSALGAERVGDRDPVKLKIGTAYAASNDYTTALVIYRDVYSHTISDSTKARADFLMGQAYMALNQPNQAYTAYLDAVENYPLSFDSYQALILLVNAGYPVSEFDRGLVDYYADQYSLSIAAFDRYLNAGGENTGTALYYKGLAYLALDSPQASIEAWDRLIQSYPEDPYWDEAWEQTAFTQWAYLDLYEEASQTLLDFVDEASWHPRASEFLFDAARITERAGNLEQAANLWERLASEFPTDERVARAIFLAGISRYRAGKMVDALTTFQEYLGNAVPLEERAAAHFWIGKVRRVMGDDAGARDAWSKAANLDPTGYYSERARDLLLDREPFTPPQGYDLTFDVSAEREEAEMWLRTTFELPLETNLSGPGLLSGDPRVIRGTELWQLGLYEQARLEFEDLRQEVAENPVNSYRLANYLVELGLYRSAVFAAREVLNLAGMDDATTMTAPVYFNHIRFGTYYRDLIMPLARVYDIHPLLFFTVVRQESLFEGFVQSFAGARGLMQIIPSTGASIVEQYGWPPNYSAEDLYRPVVSLTLGADYLDDQRDFFCGDDPSPYGACLYSGLAAYNAGPGNASIWKDLAGDDPDLFLEVVRFQETRRYLRGIYEVFSIYRRLYGRTP